jgi:transposase
VITQFGLSRVEIDQIESLGIPKGRIFCFKLLLNWRPVWMRPYSNDLRDRVVGAMESGMSCRDAGAQFGVAPSTAGNWHRLYRRTKSCAPLAIGGDRRWKLAEVRNDLEARGVLVSYAGVQRTVRWLGLRFKKNDLCLRARPA